MNKNYLESAKKQFEYYKMLGEKTFGQLPDEKLFWQINNESNSIGTIVKHLNGNMLSRWTDFLTTDGEKEWRTRDAEFDNDIQTRDELLKKWNEGWSCLFDALNSLTPEDFDKEIFIRNQGHSITEAINRQLAHYPYHIGQIIFIGKVICDKNWASLSIPKGNSSSYNDEKFSKPKQTEHFTNEYLKRINPYIAITLNENLILELTAEKHAEGLFRAVDRNRKHLSEFLPWVENMKSVSDMQHYIETCLTLHHQENEVSFVILSEGIIIGRIGLHHLNIQNKSAAIGYWLSKNMEGKGIMSKSCEAVIEYGFQNLDLNRIEIKAATANLKSQAIPKKLSFKKEGILRQAEWVNEKFIDLELYAILKDEWLEKRTN